MELRNMNRKVQLINDSFTPTEVSNLVIKSIDNQINNLKLKNLSNWIHDHNCDQNACQEKIDQLQKRKAELNGIIKDAQVNGCNLKVSDNLEISIA